jgi:glycosyltransferase involved in cell wall biosynthesis
MADCYVFPVHSVGDAIEMPLSVLEALACGVPVVSTRFGSLDDWLPASAAMIYGDTDEELTSEVVACLSRAEDAMLVDAAGGFSWGAVASRLVASLDERVEGAVPGSAGDAWPNAAGT